MLIVLGIIIFQVVFFNWSTYHDKKIEQSAHVYEKCVMSQYGVSPANWYEAHGSYPECK